MLFGCLGVHQDQMAVVQKCGEFDHIAAPGFLCLTCPGIYQTVDGYVNLRKTVFRCRCETKTRDNVFVTIVVAVQVQVLGASENNMAKLKENVKNAHYKLTDPQAQLTTYVSDVVRAVVPLKNVDELYESTDHLSNSVVHSLNNDIDAFQKMLEKAKVQWGQVQQEWAKLLQKTEPAGGYDPEMEPYSYKLFEFRRAIYELEKEQQQLIESQRNPAERQAPIVADIKAQFKNLSVKFGEKKREMQAEQDRCEELLAGPAMTSTAVLFLISHHFFDFDIDFGTKFGFSR
jgi:uncharacterized protein YhaN